MVTLLLFDGGGGNSPIERTLRRIRQAIAMDTLEKAATIPQVSQIVVATDDPAWAERLTSHPIIVDLDQEGEPFHFGRRLADLITRYGVARAFYIGAGSAPLLPPAQMAQVVTRLTIERRTALTNNLHSSDWVAFTPASAIPPLAEVLPTDNALAWVLAERAGFPVETLPRSAATQFDVDTPVDAMILALHPEAGAHSRALLRRLECDLSRLEEALAVLRREGGQVIIAGRVSASVWAALERETRCWVRVFAEERGMRASGRLARGEVRSLLAELLKLVGPEAFFRRLGEMAEAVFLDDRVLMAAHRRWPSAPDRYYSDLFEAEKVRDPFLRRFTQAAREAPLPVVLGGHSLVAGGMLALLEAMKTKNGLSARP